jgi:efflux ABC transporter, permease protein
VEIEEGKAKLDENKKEYENSKIEAEEKLAEAQQKLNSAREDIKKIEKCKWYIQDRTDNTGYTNIFDAIKTMSNISKMFPVIFYLVSVLISLTTMTRMIEEERIEIGTLKALGYTNTQIISKYILYSALACVIGGILGMTIGLYLLPNIVWKLYSMIYNIPKFYCTYRVEIGLLGIIIAFLCIGGATIIVAKKELKEMPSVLMRPKPPKKGKRILLEKMTFIWKRFNFSQKVTARNIFRYKKRAIMTIIGIAGCTGLMLTGFGIKDSVVDIPNAQFKGIFKYDSAITLTNTNELENIEKYLNDNEDIEEYTKICASAGKLEKNNINCNTNVFIPESLDNYENAYNLINYQTGEKIKLNSNGIVITDKAADMLGVTYGDYVTFVDGDDVRYEFKIENITKNHVGHYIYMTKDFYQENVKQYKTNMIYINTKDISIERQNDISRDILKFDGVASVTIIDTLMKTVSDMLNTMNYVVVILIVASALLAFVVLYNLANINIAERQREIATLKVLGFYDREVDNYINKENLIFTILGVIIGLVFGTFLTTGLISSIEIDSLRFMQNITILSYIYSAIITIAFSIIVNFIIHFVLKKINMIESLKSVE